MGRPKRISKLVFHIFLIFILLYVLKQKPFQVVTLITYVRFLADMKHILFWWPIEGISDNGQEQFVKKRCPHLNCYFTSNRTFFNDTRIFDAIVFYAPYLTKTNLILPKHRSAGQKFIFASKDSPDKHPFCNPLFDGYFNWTWTYRTDSTIQYRFISTYNLNNEKLGSHFQWHPNMSPVKRSLIAELSSKTKAAAWFSDECKSNSDREGFVTMLQKELLQYNLTVDIFGKCGPRKCKRKNMNVCYWRLKKTYFFYLALEDYIGADYVTTEVLHAFKGNAVPIVYGGADYSKFLPPRSYVNGLRGSTKQLAQYIHRAIQNRDKYHEHFHWRNHYSVQESEVLDVCTLCESINRPDFLNYKLVFQSFRKWWDSQFVKRCTGANERVVRVL